MNKTEWKADIKCTLSNPCPPKKRRGIWFQRKLEISGVVKIDYTIFKSVADMYVAEIILINKHKPPPNVDDKAGDKLTLPIELPHLEWLEWSKPHLIKRWTGIVEWKKSVESKKGDVDQC